MAQRIQLWTYLHKRGYARVNLDHADFGEPSNNMRFATNAPAVLRILRNLHCISELLRGQVAAPLVWQGFEHRTNNWQSQALRPKKAHPIDPIAFHGLASLSEAGYYETRFIFFFVILVGYETRLLLFM